MATPESFNHAWLLSLCSGAVRKARWLWVFQEDWPPQSYQKKETLVLSSHALLYIHLNVPKAFHGSSLIIIKLKWRKIPSQSLTQVEWTLCWWCVQFYLLFSRRFWCFVLQLLSWQLETHMPSYKSRLWHHLRIQCRRHHTLRYHHHCHHLHHHRNHRHHRHHKNLQLPIISL